MLESLRRKIIDFRDRRDWEQFHDPKNLAEAIVIESGELLENFLWKTCKESRNLPVERITAIGEEIADIAIFLTLMANDMGLDIETIVNRKLEINEEKYPEDLSRGRSDKYDRLGERSDQR